MNRSFYAEYIAGAIRFCYENTGFYFPDETIICVKSYSELAEHSEILGFKIYAMDMPSSFDFWLAFPSDNNGIYILHKTLEEYFNLYDIDDMLQATKNK